MKRTADRETRAWEEPSRRRIHIDINRQDRDGHAPAPYTGPTPRVGEHVVAFEPEDGVRADAVVLSVNPDRCLVVLDVDWDSMDDDDMARHQSPPSAT